MYVISVPSEIEQILFFKGEVIDHNYVPNFLMTNLFGNWSHDSLINALLLMRFPVWKLCEHAHHPSSLLGSVDVIVDYYICVPLL